MKQEFNKHGAKLAVIFAMVLVFIFSTLSFAEMKSISVFPNDSRLDLVFSVPVGSGSGMISVLPDPEGNVPEGPQAIAVDNAGSIYVADSVGRQISVYQGKDSKTIDVSFVNYIRDLTVTDDNMILLDVSDRIFVLAMDGTLEKTIKLSDGMTHSNILKIVPDRDVPGKVLLWCSNYVQFSLDNLPAKVDPSILGKAGQTVAGVGPSITSSDGHGKRNETAHYLLLNDQNSVDLLNNQSSLCGRIEPVGGGIASARIVGYDYRDWVYLLVEELGTPDPGVQVELSLRIYKKDGTLVGSMRLPLEDMAIVPWQPVAVTPSGDIYILVPGSKSISIYKAYPGNKYESRLTNKTINESESESSYDDIGIKAVAWGKFKGYPISKTRSQVRTRAMEMVNFNWTWHNTFNYKSDGQTRASLGAKIPDHLDAMAEGSNVHGIPYCWGGWDSPWTYSDNWQWTSFSNALAKYYPNNGPLVGNVNSLGGWISGTAGIDCSGFVAATSDTYYIGTVGGDQCKKPGTGNLMSDGKTVSNIVSPPSTPGNPNYVYYSGMQPMNFFIKSRHVLYYDYRLLDGSGLATVESTTLTGSGEEGAKTYTRTWSDLRSYSCRSWWDKVTGDDFDVAYTAKTGKTVIKGSQVYYKFQAAGSSTTITVTASSGDPDLYVYNSSYGYITKSTNYGSGSVTISTSAGAWYYIKIQAWNDCAYTINW